VPGDEHPERGKALAQAGRGGHELGQALALLEPAHREDDAGVLAVDERGPRRAAIEALRQRAVLRHGQDHPPARRGTRKARP
jgi:hypothetical protein